ncbi:unnamed protein product [Linum trigynum]|uniref:Uncharacterized protein n=1 Tax=Linum trigynum TaxID=586398 RepID=A0AAV2E8W3_9ROSI
MDGSQSAMSSDEPDSLGVHAAAAPRVINRPEGRDQQKRKKRGGGDSSAMEAFQKSLTDMAASSATHAKLVVCLIHPEREINFKEIKLCLRTNHHQLLHHLEDLPVAHLMTLTPRTSSL